MRRTTITAFLFFFPSLLLAQGGDNPSLSVRVEGIKKPRGEINISLFNTPTGYPLHAEDVYKSEWIALKEGDEAVGALFPNLPPGEYAVFTYHDENGNRMADKNSLGRLKEAAGYSNDRKAGLTPPKFKKTKLLLLKGETQDITIKLDYP